MSRLGKIPVVAIALYVSGCAFGPDIDKVPPGEYNPSEDVMGGQSGLRLQRRMLVTPDGARQFVGWYDSELDENCSFRKMADGKQYCMPIDGMHVAELSSPFSAVISASDDCSNPVKLWAPTSACGDVVPRYVLHEAADNCGDSTVEQIYKIGDSVKPPQFGEYFYANYEGTCYRIGTFESTVDFGAYSVTKITAEHFVSSSEKLD